MKETIRIITLFFLSVSVHAAFAFTAGAQDEAMPFSRIPQSASVISVGGVALTDSGNAFSSFANAAVIPYSSSRMNAAVSYMRLHPGSDADNRINAGLTFRIGKNFGIGGGIAYGMDSPYEITDESGTVTGNYKPSDLLLNIGLGWKFLPFLSVGADIKYLRDAVAEGYSYNAVSTDIFLMSRFNGVSIAAGVSSLGNKVSSSSGEKYSLPSSFDIGFEYQLNLHEHHSLKLLADADYFFSRKFATSAGLSYTWNSMLTARCGYHYGGKSVVPSYASAGIGVKFFGISLDAAYLFGSGILKNSLGISLGYEF